MANQNLNDSEMDMAQISNHVKKTFSRINDSFFDAILFVKRNIIILAVLCVAGIALGYYKDGNDHVYENKIYVYPNFGSVDFLYEEIVHLNSKILKQDPDFMAKSGIKSTDKFIKIEIEPVIDIYGFVNDNPNTYDDNRENVNYQLFRMMADKGDVNKIMQRQETARNYKKHLITITTSDQTNNADLIEPIFKYLNSSEYYTIIQKEEQASLAIKIAENTLSINQIDSILTNFSSKASKGSSLVYYNDNTELNELVKIKSKLVREQEKNRINTINYSKIIKEGAYTYNIKKETFSSNNMKIIYPLLFIIVFVFVVQFRKYYRYQTEKRKKVIV
jgi:hypothetical protein